MKKRGKESKRVKKRGKERKKGVMEKGGKEFDKEGKDGERVRKEKSAEKGLAKGKKTG